jgi:copper chaperone NosL
MKFTHPKKVSAINSSMYKNVLVLFLGILLLSCSVKPEPLIIGKDACNTCKMTLMDKRFGAEIVTKKGKVYKFDDLNCMVKFITSASEPEENIAFQLVVDFEHAEKLIDLKQAYYCQSDKVKSPMSSHIAAFEMKEDLERYNKEWDGVAVDWQELVAKFK